MPFAARFSCCATIDFNSILKYLPKGLWLQIIYQNLWNLSNYWYVEKSFLPRFLPNVLSITGLFLNLLTVNFLLSRTDKAFCFFHYLAPSLKADLNLKQAFVFLQLQEITSFSIAKYQFYIQTCNHKGILIVRASFCCSKWVRRLHLFSTKVAFISSEKVAFIFNESCIYAQTLQTTVIYSRGLFTCNAKYFQTFLGEKWWSFANSLPSMLKLLSTEHEVAWQFYNLPYTSRLMFGRIIFTIAFRLLFKFKSVI